MVVGVTRPELFPRPTARPIESRYVRAGRRGLLASRRALAASR